MCCSCRLGGGAATRMGVHFPARLCWWRYTIGTANPARSVQSLCSRWTPPRLGCFFSLAGPGEAARGRGRGRALRTFSPLFFSQSCWHTLLLHLMTTMMSASSSSTVDEARNRAQAQLMMRVLLEHRPIGLQRWGCTGFALLGVQGQWSDYYYPYSA